MTKEQDEFPFDRARRVSEKETAEFRKAISDQFNVKLRKRERPAKDKSEKYVRISIRLDPAVIERAKKQTDLKRGKVARLSPAATRRLKLLWNETFTKKTK